MVRQKTRVLAASLLLAGLAAGCGGGSENKASGPPMTPTDPPSAQKRGENHPPEIRNVRLEPEHPVGGDAVRAIVDATDPDGDRLRFDYSWKLNGSPLGISSSRVELTDASKGDKLELVVRARDGQEESPPMGITVSLANRPPTLSSVELDAPGRLVSGSQVTARAIGHDLDGDAVHLRYAWRVNGQLMMEMGPVLSTEGLRRDDTIQVRVTASDGQASTSLDSPLQRLENAPPQVTTAPGKVNPSGVLSYQIQAKDLDGDRPLRFRLLEAPTGMTISSALGEIEWRPSVEQAGEHAVTV